MPVAPIRREVGVAASVERAFALFTAHIGAWWPVASHGVFGEGAVVAFEGSVLVERRGEQTAVWADVVEWDAPHALRLRWYPGSGPERATDVRVSFAADGAGTRVLLEHGGWERRADPVAAAAEYTQGWPTVLGRFHDWAARLATAGRAGPPADESGDDGRWYAIVARPGPAVEPGQSLFAHPLFREHVAFLERLDARGLLVAAGPLTDEPGAGMTVVRVRPEHGDVDVEHLATVDDLAVAGGYLTVTVRPWSVLLSGTSP